MTELEKQQLNEKIAKWLYPEYRVSCLKFPPHLTWIQPNIDPDDDKGFYLPDFLNSMDALIKWTFPKLPIIEIHKLPTGYYCRIMFQKAVFYEGKDIECATAVCLALEKLIDRR